EPSEADDLRHHLTDCAQCRRLHEAFQASQTWLTTFAVPEFDEASLATLRASVLSEIERQEKRGSWLDRLLPKWNPRLVLAVSTAALVVVTSLSVTVYRIQIASLKLGDGRVSVVTGGYPLQITPGNQQASTPTVKERRVRRSKPSESALLPEEALNNGGLSFPLEPPVIVPEQTESETTPPAEPEDKEPKEMLRIELQTADPNIRIIWLTPKADSPSNTKTK
ncbi:MAG: hypothetical protein JNK38_01655, partial [Acidobacteria bacterium]|nr:hypothetical protein [Acidobacteriota bacterium]